MLLPTFQYRNSLAAANDPFYEQMLLQMIAVLKGRSCSERIGLRRRADLALSCRADLETETNFAYHIKELGWNLPVR